MRGLIYKVTHEASGRVYIGQTIRPLAQRWREHQRQTECTSLHRAVLKYGAESFSVEVVASASSKLQLDMLECFWITVHQATDRAFGFNLREGGSSGRISDETRKRMSERMQRAMQDPIYRKKMADSRIGREVSSDTRASIARSNTGKQHTAETVELMAGIRRSLWQDPAYREAVTAAQTAGKQTTEARTAAAEKSRSQWADPEKRKKLLEAQAAGKARARAARARA